MEKTSLERKLKKIKERAGRFTKGMLAGVWAVHSFPTSIRKKRRRSSYYESGALIGSIATISSLPVIYNSISEEKAFLAFVPLVALNLASGFYEAGRYLVNRIRENPGRV